MFASLTETQKSYLENATINGCIITRAEIAEAKEVLGLVGKTVEELTAIRNSVVRHLADFGNEAREAGDWDKFDQSRANMSGITCAIDSVIYA